MIATLACSVASAEGYTPEGRAFVCENGSNRYTRALYGSPTDYRIETSDRPVFAIFKKGKHRNVRLRLNGVALDSTTNCIARYEDGMRNYTVRHKDWGKHAVAYVKVVADLNSETAYWRVQTVGFDDDPQLQVVVSGIVKPRLWRNGDIGVDPADAFEADGKQPLAVLDVTADETVYIEAQQTDLTTSKTERAEQRFDRAEQAMRQLAGRVTFNTPDPYINTLGGALVVAADGDWDGKTWLHGCVGWRMPLAGWRAGFLGDVMGWPERAISHFDAYAKSQVTNLPASMAHPTQDAEKNLARAEKRWGTQMYSDGYICRNPERNDQMHHYDMNLNYVDELLWHFQYDADREYLRKMWPLLTRHLAWEKRNFDPDEDHLYDAYCCIWASDGLYYSGGAVTHSSAYNYRGNLLAARIAELIGENPVPYRQEAEAILEAMNSRLWINGSGHWAEYQDLMGMQRLHESAALWSIYTPIDCEACSGEQAFRATQYVDREIPHIPVTRAGEKTSLCTIATSNWMPYVWSVNNVAAAEVMHMALAYFKAGRNDEGYRLLKANVMDQMYWGKSPGNFGQISKYDAARGECYRDFGDCIGISARTLIQGLFGIEPEALYERCIIRPGLPSDWDEASVSTPYLEYKFRRTGGDEVYEVTQKFKKPLKIVLRQNLGQGKYRDVEGTAAAHQVIRVKSVVKLPTVDITPTESKLPNLAAKEPEAKAKYRQVNIDKAFNANVSDIFHNRYESPRPPYTTLQLPVQGVSEWCHPTDTFEVNDSVFRTMIEKGTFRVAGVPFRTPAVGQNIAYTSLWDNYPDEICIPVSGNAMAAWLLMAGSTNHMQCRIDNGLVLACYQDGTADTLRLVNPDTWCPIEQDFYSDGKAFSVAQPRPYRVAFASGLVSRDLGKALKLKGPGSRTIRGGAATMLYMPLNEDKKLKEIRVLTLSNDVVIGLMAVTLQ